MHYRIVDGPADTATVVLDGKLDYSSAGQIELPMSVLAGSKKGLIIDLSALTFLASIGIRHLVTAAKAIQRKGGRIVLLRPTAAIAEVLATSGITELMPIVQSDTEARSALGLAS
jgi:anti-anti-sigma factor